MFFGRTSKANSGPAHAPKLPFHNPSVSLFSSPFCSLPPIRIYDDHPCRPRKTDDSSHMITIDVKRANIRIFAIPFYGILKAIFPLSFCLVFFHFAREKNSPGSSLSEYTPGFALSTLWIRRKDRAENRPKILITNGECEITSLSESRVSF